MSQFCPSNNQISPIFEPDSKTVYPMYSQVIRAISLFSPFFLSPISSKKKYKLLEYIYYSLLYLYRPFFEKNFKAKNGYKPMRESHYGLLTLSNVVRIRDIYGREW